MKATLIVATTLALTQPINAAPSAGEGVEAVEPEVAPIDMPIEYEDVAPVEEAPIDTAPVEYGEEEPVDLAPQEHVETDVDPIEAEPVGYGESEVDPIEADNGYGDVLADAIPTSECDELDDLEFGGCGYEEDLVDDVADLEAELEVEAEVDTVEDLPVEEVLDEEVTPLEVEPTCENLGIEDLSECLAPAPLGVCVPVTEIVHETVMDTVEPECITTTITNLIEETCNVTITETAEAIVETPCGKTVTVPVTKPCETVTKCDVTDVQPTMTSYHFEYEHVVIHPTVYETETMTHTPEPTIETETVDESVTVTPTITITTTVEVASTVTVEEVVLEGTETVMNVKTRTLEPLVEELYRTIHVPMGCTLAEEACEVLPTEVDPVEMPSYGGETDPTEVDPIEAPSYGEEVDPIEAMPSYGEVDDVVAELDYEDDVAPIDSDSGYGSDVAPIKADEEYGSDMDLAGSDPVDAEVAEPLGTGEADLPEDLPLPI